MTTYETLRQQLMALDRVAGINPLQIPELPEALRGTVRKMLRRGMTLGELAGELNLPVAETQALGDLLVDKGFLRSERVDEDGGIRYRVHVARAPARNVPLDL